MARNPLSDEQRAWGERLGRALQRARQAQKINIAKLAVQSRVSVHAIQSIESHRAHAPGFFTIAALARELDLDLDKLARRAMSKRK